MEWNEIVIADHPTTAPPAQQTTTATVRLYPLWILSRNSIYAIRRVQLEYRASSSIIHANDITSHSMAPVQVIPSAYTQLLQPLANNQLYTMVSLFRWISYESVEKYSKSNHELQLDSQLQAQLLHQLNATQGLQVWMGSCHNRTRVQ